VTAGDGDDRLLTMAQVAALRHVDLSTVSRWVSKGRLNPVETTPCRRFRESDARAVVRGSGGRGPAVTEDGERLLTVAHVAALHHVDTRTVYAWVSKGRLDPVETTPRFRFRESDARAVVRREQALTAEERAAIVSGYQAGETIRELAKRLGRSYGGVHKVLAEAGVLRPLGPRGRRTERT
jgi:hypothetical protein